MGKIVKIVGIDIAYNIELKGTISMTNEKIAERFAKRTVMKKLLQSKKSLNKSLSKAKINKKDEFYTQLTDIEKELGHYRDLFKNKVIFCNCDDPEESDFWNYFTINFEFFGLKRLVSTHFETEKPSYKLEIVSDINNDGKINKLDTIEIKLKQNGDFRSPECIEILKEADIIITNPPFSLFREYVAQLIEYNKKFIIIGNPNAITYKEIFKLIKENKLWLGHKSMGTDMLFNVSKHYAKELTKTKKENSGYKIIDGIVKGRTQAVWFTNLKIKKRYEDLILYRTYYGNENKYPKYDNYDAINVDKVKDIPMDYKDITGVPITFMDKYNPDQFEIIGQMVTTKVDEFNQGYPYINGKKKYARILIKNKKI